jgi:hypothetical protein
MAQAVRTADSPTPSLLPALSRIVEMAKLSPNWDGEDAEPPTAEAVAAACFLIEAVAERRLQQGDVVIPPATSSPIPDGGLQIEWRGPAARIDVQANPDGSFGYLVKWSTGSTARYEETDAASLEAVLALIDRVLG